MNNLPDAIHIGFSKCGSTFLQAFFRQHPEIYLTHKLHFFSPFPFSNYDKGIEYYSSFFPNSAGKVKIDSDEHIILPIYHPKLGSAATTKESVIEVCNKINETVPSIKIILVIRNHKSLLLSRYSEYLLGGGKSKFKVFVDENLSCSLDHKNYFQNYYADIITTLYQFFGKSNVLVLLQEELQKNGDKTIESLCSFLNIKIYYPAVKKIREKRIGLSLKGMKLMRLLNIMLVIKPELFITKTRTRSPYWIYKSALRLVRLFDYYLPNSMKGKRNKLLTPDLVNQINTTFEKDNKELASLLGKNINQLGYN
ncbi:MAG: sulfotransferase domain-containing protein [Ignavibacteriales bacterium]|nr:sulfotransferase domain-containing protein [Ignavibacteriales bacterium]